jgi:hypothetical protein
MVRHLPSFLTPGRTAGFLLTSPQARDLILFLSPVSGSRFEPRLMR